VNKKSVSSLAFILAVGLIMSAAVGQAQAQKPEIERLQSPAGAPNVQISQVRNAGIQGDDATLVIEVSWTATAPQTTHINGFQMLIEVEYADGSKNKTAPANATPPRTLLRVLNKGANNPKRFTITVVSEFTAPSTTPLSATEEFDLSKGNAFDGHASSSAQSRGQFLNIAEVKKQTLGCTPSDNCFEVSWGVASNVPGIAAVNKFNVEGEFTYKFGQSAGVVRNQSANVDDGSKREVTLKVTDVPSGTGDLSIHVKATVKAFVTLATTKTTVKDGSF
jgi:hypothetical protein